MSKLIKLEELAMFLFGIFLFSHLSFTWWWFPALILAPDIGMLGYIFNNKAGAVTYNLFHHKGIAILLLICGYFLDMEGLKLAGIILFSHSALDRMLGYGLKYMDDFKSTHLGQIGKA